MLLPLFGVCLATLLFFIFFLVLWFKSRERDLIEKRLVLTRAFRSDAMVNEMVKVWHPRLRENMFNYNPSLFIYRNQRYIAHRLSSFNMCGNILKHTNKRDGVINSIVIQTPLNHIIFIDYSHETEFPCPEAYEDPRTLVYQNNLVIIVSNPQHEKCKTTMTALFINLEEAGDLESISLLQPSRIVELLYEKSRAIEKNWMPFVWHDHLYFVYSVNPHVILHCDTVSGMCVPMAITKYPKDVVFPNLRGGSPCLFLPDRRQYLTIGHVRHSIAGVKFVYTSVLYLFESEPPFRIVAISPEFFFDDEFEIYHFKHIIQFVAGLVLDENDHRLYISYGMGDCKSKILSLPLDSVLALLTPLPTPSKIKN